MNRRFAAPLPEFYERRIVVWIDEDQEFADKLDEITVNGAKVVAFTGSNNFYVKKLLTASSRTMRQEFLAKLQMFISSAHQAYCYDFVSDWMHNVRQKESSFNMKSTESMEKRLQRVDMHDYFLNRIGEAMEKENYIEASWLIYSCFENRFFRTIQKYREMCKYCRSKSKCNHKQSNELALATKIRCVQRLHENGVSCFRDTFRHDLFKETLDWIDKRNKLMHELLSLEYYQRTDEQFRTSAETGLRLLYETYDSCTRFRTIFYTDGYEFIFPEAAMDGCSCKPREKAEG